MRSRAVQEQGDGRFAVERRDRVPALAGDSKELAAGHQHPQVGGLPNQSCHDFRGRREQLFEVVQDEQHRPLAKVDTQRLGRRLVGRLPDTEGHGDRRLHDVRILERGEVHEPDAIREQVARASRHGERKPRLAAAAGSGQGDDPAGEQVGPDTVDLVLPADEGRDLARKVRWNLGRSERPSIISRAGDDQPVQRDRIVEILDGPRTVVDQLDVGQTGQPRELARQRCHEGVRNDDLSAVSSCGDPGGVVDVDPDVVLRLVGGVSAQAPLPEVEAHPNPHGHPVGPWLGRDASVVRRWRP